MNLQNSKLASLNLYFHLMVINSSLLLHCIGAYQTALKN